MKLNDAQKFKLRQALDNASSVLREIKANKLVGQSLADMKTLEQAVQTLETLVL